MKIIKANTSHKAEILRLLDDFRTDCAYQINPKKASLSHTAKDFGGKIFDEVISSDNSAIFLGIEDGKFIAIATVHKIPQIRKGEYSAEIEEIFVADEFQGKGLGIFLIDAITLWAKENDIKTIRLESDNHLKNAHKFYFKAGFEEYGKAFIKIKI
ncbi:GNAT family N-acetyltransferase [Candidatus Gracilibacteria bacterium]|nr:GNAT family N-acetyltransferase [Candidatus Gracilibacteria bacterium]NUJ98325.1 GNAT family N-acetyltransferase [Candidatus Gracilibacteria bacterium]NUJ99320.1 GNAT family N-acetyltransferase [Candidatus Gracilibacteria bacterium]